MNIGIIGAGNIGATAARLFANAGHRVAISNSRGPEALRDLVAELGPNVETTTVEDAARSARWCWWRSPLRTTKRYQPTYSRARLSSMP
jgi:glycine/D-amino acid oxidase-like deaminating enzyme